MCRTDVCVVWSPLVVFGVQPAGLEPPLVTAGHFRSNTTVATVSKKITITAHFLYHCSEALLLVSVSLQSTYLLRKFLVETHTVQPALPQTRQFFVIVIRSLSQTHTRAVVAACPIDTHGKINIEINIYLGTLFQIDDLPLYTVLTHTLGSGRPSKIYLYSPGQNHCRQGRNSLP